MQAVEFETKVLPEGTIELPETLRAVLPNTAVRVVVLWSGIDIEEAAWQQAALTVFREGDGPHDALYDNL